MIPDTHIILKVLSLSYISYSFNKQTYSEYLSISRIAIRQPNMEMGRLLVYVPLNFITQIEKQGK